MHPPLELLWVFSEPLYINFTESFVSEYLCLTKFERMNNNMLGNITVGIVIVLAVAACGLGVWLDRAKSDSQDNNTDAQSKN